MIDPVSKDTGALYAGTHGDLNIIAKVPDCQPTSALEYQVLPTRSADIVDNEEAHERLLASCEALTQNGLDVVLQYSKDTNILSPTSESNLIVVLQQLVKATGGLPARFDLAGVTVSGAAKARGGSADIYQGYIQGKDVCVKRIRRTKDTQDKISKNVLDEVILCGYLPAHPNILPLLGIYREGDIQSLVYLWMGNGHLVSYLKRYPDSDRLQLINILITGSARACIADFGLSSILPARGGTPHCQAPELFGEAHNMKATDIYAFGCLAYEVFAGKQPFSETLNQSFVMNMVLKGHRPKRPPSISPSWNVWGLTDDVWALIEACWTEHPMERPTIDAVIQSLERALFDDKN
ncbi:hypothetical protein H0H92_009613 [Tricholoma furcatifolium]|nr:hypothetical protein H0H92_009613 [Tricholoma furcatifolium]